MSEVRPVALGWEHSRDPATGHHESFDAGMVAGG
jgi:hypothetical protein